MSNRAFQGFTALPAPDMIQLPGDGLEWFEVLGVAKDAPWSAVRSAYRDLCREAKPEQRRELNVAYDQAKAWHK